MQWVKIHTPKKDEPYHDMHNCYGRIITTLPTGLVDIAILETQDSISAYLCYGAEFVCVDGVPEEVLANWAMVVMKR